PAAVRCFEPRGAAPVGGGRATSPPHPLRRLRVGRAGPRLRSALVRTAGPAGPVGDADPTDGGGRVGAAGQGRVATTATAPPDATPSPPRCPGPVRGSSLCGAPAHGPGGTTPPGCPDGSAPHPPAE